MTSMSVTLIVLILINAVFTYKGLEDFNFLEKYKFNVGAVRRGEYYRLITGAFLHGGWWHFFVNMFTLYFFFPIVENHFGTLPALLIYVGGMLAGNGAAYYFHRHQSWYSAVGNSGAVNAILFSSILVYPGMKIMIFPLPIPIPSIVYAVLYLFYTGYGMERQKGFVGHEAHWGGAAAGIVLSILLDPSLFYRQTLLAGLLILVLAGIFFYIRKQRL